MEKLGLNLRDLLAIRAHIHGDGVLVSCSHSFFRFDCCSRIFFMCDDFSGDVSRYCIPAVPNTHVPIWTAGQRTSLTSPTSSFVWKLSDEVWKEVKFSAWDVAGHQPDNAGEYCLLTAAPKSFLWHDANCLTLGCPLCEVDLTQ